mmetsp:Transcript_10569/g.26888  ORF Transcript_10569/g.26888 Transcript_10569/m.26888 type:complete len:205 (-) Transcript_10569:164-778(-)
MNNLRVSNTAVGASPASKDRCRRPTTNRNTLATLSPLLSVCWRCCINSTRADSDSPKALQHTCSASSAAPTSGLAVCAPSRATATNCPSETGCRNDAWTFTPRSTSRASSGSSCARNAWSARAKSRQIRGNPPRPDPKLAAAAAHPSRHASTTVSTVASLFKLATAALCPLGSPSNSRSTRSRDQVPRPFAPLRARAPSCLQYK